MAFKQPLVLGILLILMLFIQIPVSYCCQEGERTALLTFKSYLSDPSGRLSSWQGRNCCNWHGIYCSNDSFHVVSIDLRNPNPDTYMRNFYSVIVPTDSSQSTALNGTISPSLFNLSHLVYLDLSHNNLDFSKISQDQFSNLKSLTYLDISHSMFSGHITTQFSNLSSLQYLDISCALVITDYSFYSYNFNSSRVSYNRVTAYFSSSYVFSTDLSWLSSLINLKVLRLSGVDLSVASTTKNWAEPISSLSNLKQLDLSDCSISSPVPINELLNLSRLSSLRMGSNFLKSSIPIQLTNLSSLSVLDFTDCHLKGSISYLPQLKELYVGVNPDLVVDLAWMFDHQWPKLQILSSQLTKVIGPIPNSISNATSLVSLDLTGGSIQGSLPASICNLSKLEYLHLNYNNITGYVPFSISNLKILKVLSLIQNNLQGPIPESVCEISFLEQINLGSNNLIGTIPSCIGKLKHLQRFDVSDNSIGGTFSLISLINESNITWVNLNSNKISVEIDQNPLLSNFQLQFLGLQSCNLNGYIPTFICNLTQLLTLDLDDNNLTGAIPSCLFKLPNLSYLDLSKNNLQGTIPHSLHHSLLFGFPRLNLASNNLSGPLPLPPENVGVFDLSRNQFTGGISFDIGKRLSNIGYVSLSDNKLSGSIPLSICSQNSVLRHLDLSKNLLFGTLPSSLQLCNSLISLNLGMNSLTGNLSNDQLEWTKKLKNLQLNGNNLNGIFPSFIRQLHDLEVLNIGNNNFEGSIPTFIGALRNLKILILTSNKFNGSIPKEITHLRKLQILDLSKNKLSGQIPEKLANLEMLTSRPLNRVLLGDEISFMYSGVQLQIVTKGTIQQLELVYNYNSAIDLSSNNLEGNIPQDMVLLKGLYILNLSHNHLLGKIPVSVGNMTGLGSLDLSFNKLSGDIPQALTLIDSLGYLNLSYNNLYGRIPRGPHFDTLSVDASAYIGNTLLCGFPINRSCDPGDPRTPTDTTLQKDADDQEDVREKWLFIGVVIMGIGVGFWGLFLVLLLKKEKWWFGYWRVVDAIALRIAGCILRK